MVYFAIRLVITFITLIFVIHLIPDIRVLNLADATLFAFVLGVLNATVRPLLTLITLPLSIFTLGLFGLVINTITFWLASEMSYGVKIEGLEGAILGGALVWIIGVVCNLFFWKSEMFD